MASSQWIFTLLIPVGWIFPALSKAHANYFLQRTSLMVSITLFLEGLGQHIPGLQGGQLCKFIFPSLIVRYVPASNVSFSVNWYQRNYPYVWAGARLVRDD